jgi:hypothetical protein
MHSQFPNLIVGDVDRDELQRTYAGFIRQDMMRNSRGLIRQVPEMQRVHVLSSPSPACLESSPSPSFSWQDSSPSPSPVGFESESESRCLWLESESESQRSGNFSGLVKAFSTIP